MQDFSAIPLLLLGSMFLVSLIISPIANKFNIPRVSLFISCGLIIGQMLPEQLHQLTQQWFSMIANVTLLIVGYLLGTELTRDYLKNYAKVVSISTIAISLTTFIVVCSGLLLLGFALELSAILAAVAVATDPASTLDVIKQSRLNNRFTQILQGIVALDDAVALVIFSVVLSVVSVLAIDEPQFGPLLHMAWELSGAVLLGAAVGALLVWLLNMKRYADSQQQSVLIESLGLILLTGGLSLYFQFSFLLAAMVMGVVVVNFSDDSQQHLHELEFIEQPLLVLFFILAGASPILSLDTHIIGLVIAYLILRTAGRFVAGFLLPKQALNRQDRHCLGIALLPQAGIAMGMALLASQQFPEHANTIITVTIMVTVLFELVGPMFTSFALKRIERGNNN
ncbi:cation:proton antiporter [Thalassotalea maritima]|uniref:cation:proton antiporter n=1 Tax=Thalassotalea maritima TaxID=3242416 RepID=UPI00352741C6